MAKMDNFDIENGSCVWYEPTLKSQLFCQAHISPGVRFVRRAFRRAFIYWPGACFARHAFAGRELARRVLAMRALTGPASACTLGRQGRQTHQIVAITQFGKMGRHLLAILITNHNVKND